jgi:hypothetical protein
MPSTPEEKSERDGTWRDEAMMRPPIEVLGEDGVSRPLDEESEEAAHSRAAAAEDVRWLEVHGAAEELRDLATAAGSFTARVVWEPCGPGDVVLGWMDPVFTEDSRVLASVTAGPAPSGTQHLAEIPVIVTHVRALAGKLLIGLRVGGEQPVRPRVDILVVNP